MRFTRKSLLRLGALLISLAGLFILVGFIILQSDWFRDQIRQRLIAQTEQVTGGKVEIGSFEYDARKLTATLHDFVIHGTEPAGVPPLLRVDTTVVTIRILSLLERSADISSILLIHPQVNLIVQPDGSTNLPSPKSPGKRKDPVEELFALKLNHFEIDNGLLVMSDARIPLNIRSDDVSLLLNYRRPEKAYDLAVSTASLDLASLSRNIGPIALFTKIRFNKNHAAIQTLTFTGPQSSASVTGDIDNFAKPVVTFKLEAIAPAAQLAALEGLSEIKAGRIEVRGSGRYDTPSGFVFHGQTTAQQLDLNAGDTKIKNIGGSTDLDVTNANVLLKRLSLKALGAQFSGSASIKNRRQLQFEGELTNVSLKELASLLTHRPFAWAGVAHGSIRGSASLNPSTNDFAAQTDVLVSPSLGGIPVSGAVRASYSQRDKLLEFGTSSLTFPHSTITFSGFPRGETQLVLDTSDLAELKPVLTLSGANVTAENWPLLLEDGTLHYQGSIANLLVSPNFKGRLSATDLSALGMSFNSLDGYIEVGPNGINVSSLNVRQVGASISADGLLGFEDWHVQSDAPLRASIALSGVDISQLSTHFPSLSLPPLQGIASGSIQLHGTLSHPEGNAHITSNSLDAYGERLNQVQFDADLTGDRFQVLNGRVVTAAASLRFAGSYTHQAGDWQKGEGDIKIDTNGFPVASLSSIRRYWPGLDSLAEIHLTAAGRLNDSRFEPSSVNGSMDFKNIVFRGDNYGNIALKATTQSDAVEGTLSGELRRNPFSGKFKVQLGNGNQTSADLNFERISIASIYSLIYASSAPLLDGFTRCHLSIQGPLRNPEFLRATLRADQLELSSKSSQTAAGVKSGPTIVLHNSGPLVVELADRIANIRSFHIEGESTNLSIAGAVPLNGKAMDVHVDGSVNLNVFHLFDPNVESSGVSVMAASIGGALSDPTVTGTLTLKDGSFFLENLPNGLSAVNGVVTFNRNRATLQKMTAHSGGGDLSLGGFVSFGNGGPLVYHLEGSADNVRIRYAGSISVTGSSKLRLSGSSSSSLLSGTISVARVVFNANTDVGNIIASLGAPGSAQSDNLFLSGLHLDIAVENAPNMELSTALSRDVEAEIDLRLRGTPDHPILLGSLSANQGDIQAFGSRYTINRGEISFVNSVKIEPVLDLDLETQARGVTVDITISGTLNKLNIAYRSDPPLQPREIIALLAVGRAPDAVNQNTNLPNGDAGSLQAGANSLLGAAVTSPLSNRLSKLFGITNVRIEPLVQSSTLTPQARVSLEQQISRNITITYVTNLSQTSEQIFRFEWAFSRQFSVVALRDDNGEFGIDFQYKKQFK